MPDMLRRYIDDVAAVERWIAKITVQDISIC
jgi:hypothetical protein